MKVPIVEKILSANDHLAQENQALLDSHGVLGVNLMASPGAGKTSLIEATIDVLQGRLRLRRRGYRSTQVETRARDEPRRQGDWIPGLSDPPPA